MVRSGRALGRVVLAAAVVLAGAGGSAVGLGAPGWLAGAVGAVSALVAAVVADRVYASREGRADAEERRRRVLDELRALPTGRGDVLGLLRAGRSPMPFRGRGRELSQLAAWRDDASACPVLMVSGPGGVGKSRLALESGLRVPPGWAAGWLHAGAGGAAVGAVRECGDPALIVVDDADGRADLIPLLESLAEQSAGPAVRLILVSRSAEGLRAALGRRLEERHAWIVGDAPVLEMEPTGGPDDWDRWYAEAVAAFAAARKHPAPAVADRFRLGPGGAAQSFAVMQAQALLAVLDAGDGDDDPRDLPFGRVAGALMEHEQRWWQALAATWDWGSGGPPALAVQERSVTALALLGGDSPAEAWQVLRRVPELGDAPTERLSAIGSWVLALYPPGADLAPRIRPDLIGDWFVVTQLGADSGLARSLRAGLTDDQAARALALLARAADSIATAASLFSEFAAGDIRRIILAATQAARTGRAGRRLLDAIIAGQLPSAPEWTLDRLDEIGRLIPEHMLLQTHVTIASLTVDAYRTLAADNAAAHQADLARALNNLGLRLDRAGRHQDALHAAEEAVTIYRALATGNPAHQVDLAQALNNLGAYLDRAGRYQDVLYVTEEAVTIYRALAGDNLAPHRARLALALSNFGAGLYRVGRYQDVLHVTEEAVTIYRALATGNPAAYQADLAGALNNFGAGLYRVGRYHDVLYVFEEAVTIYRALAAGNPAHQVDLADALNNLGAYLDWAGRYQDALYVTEEAVTIYRALAADNPAAHQADLARALNNLGSRLDRAGRYQEALYVTEEAVTIYRALAAGNPAAHQADLALALTNLGVYLDRMGRYQDALHVTEEAITIYRALAAGNPAPHQADLARALNNLGTRLNRVGRYQEALYVTEEAVTIYRALAGDNPAAHQADLALALTNLGTYLEQAGSYQEMLATRTEAVGIFRELASADPELYQAEYQRLLGALRREYDQRGMSQEALTHDLPPRHGQPPKVRPDGGQQLR